MLSMIGHHLLKAVISGHDCIMSTLLLDEPTLHLHPSMIRPLFDIFDQLHTDFAVQLILTSHSSDLISHLLRRQDPHSRIIATDTKPPTNVPVHSFAETLTKVNAFFDPPLVRPGQLSQFMYYLRQMKRCCGYR
jgi:AAA15 family ATPase/GTPase